MSNPYISQISAFGCNFALKDWSFCAGQLLPIPQNSALFALLGTLYGGDGRNTTGLPDLRGRVPVGSGAMPGGQNYRIGSPGGYEKVQISAANLPEEPVSFIAHGKTTAKEVKIGASENGPDTHDPDGAFQATWPATQPVYASALSDPSVPFSGVPIPDLDVNVTGTTSALGAGQALENRSPYLAINWQICLDGIFPSRGG